MNKMSARRCAGSSGIPGKMRIIQAETLGYANRYLHLQVSRSQGITLSFPIGGRNMGERSRVDQKYSDSNMLD